MKKLIFTLLCIILCFWVVPPYIFAEEVDSTPPELTIDQQNCTVATQVFTITGVLSEDGKVEISFNGNRDDIQVKANEKFSKDIKLELGENEISLYAYDMSENTARKSLNIIYNPNAPVMTIDQIPDMVNTKTEYGLQEVSNSEYTISGSLNKTGFVLIYINDDKSNVHMARTDSDNKFSCTVNLKDFKNKLYIVSSDYDNNFGSIVTFTIFNYDLFIDDIPAELTLNQTDCKVNTPIFTITGTKSKGFGDFQYKLNDNEWSDIPYYTEDGFAITLNLVKGLNIIQLKIEDRYEKIVKKPKEIILVTYDPQYDPVNDPDMAPLKLTLDQKDSMIKDTSFTISGSLNKYGKVSISINGGASAVINTGADKKFSSKLALLKGENTINILPLDADGNSGDSVTLKVHVDIDTQSVDFPDISGHWAEYVITSNLCKGILTGLPDGKFHPDDTLTIAQAITMFVKALNIPTVGGADSYWADPYINGAMALGIVKPGEVTDLNRDSACSRQYAAILTTRALKCFYKSTLPFQTEIDKQAAYIIDWASVQNIQDVQICTAVGIISGKPITTPGKFIFDPNGALTRAEGASIIERLLVPSTRVKPSDVK